MRCQQGFSTVPSGLLSFLKVNINPKISWQFLARGKGLHSQVTFIYFLSPFDFAPFGSEPSFDTEPQDEVQGRRQGKLLRECVCIFEGSGWGIPPLTPPIKGGDFEAHEGICLWRDSPAKWVFQRPIRNFLTIFLSLSYLKLPFFWKEKKCIKNYVPF